MNPLYTIPRSTYLAAECFRNQPGTVRILPAIVKSIDPKQRSTVRRDPRGWPANPRLTGGYVTVESKEGRRFVSIRPVIDPLADTMGPWSPTTLHCDFCSRVEDADDLTPDWNGETGNHLSCEAAS